MGISTIRRRYKNRGEVTTLEDLTPKETEEVVEKPKRKSKKKPVEK